MEILSKELNYKINVQWNECKDMLSPLKILTHSLKKMKNINASEAFLCQSEGVSEEGRLWISNKSRVKLEVDVAPLSPGGECVLFSLLYLIPLLN